MVENCNFVAQKCSSNCVTFGEFDKPDSLPDLASVITPHNSEIEKVAALIAQTFYVKKRRSGELLEWAFFAPFDGPRLPSRVTSGTTEIQRHFQVWRGGPRTPTGATKANLDCAFVENTLFFIGPKIGRVLTPLAPLYNALD